MRLLLDTQAIWWLLAEPEKLRADARTVLAGGDARLFYSPVSLFEFAIKRAKGKFAFADDVLLGGMDRLAMAEVPVRRGHALRAGSLPPHHADPFDRLIIAQALEEDLLLVSSDGVFRHYGVRLLQA